jgi:arylsulfatase A-like enzyme
VNSTRPFCLVWASTAPHASGYHRGTKLTSTTARLGDRVGQYPPYACKRGHAAQVEQHIDQDVGLLLDLLEANPYLDENTVVVFASDNGPHAQCTDDVTFNPSFYLGSGGLRGYKHSIWDGGLRVPGIVRWKGKVAAGSVSKVPQSLYDLQHTFLDMAGITPTQTGGSSLVDVWTKGDKAKPVRAWVHLEFCDTPFVDASCSTATLDVADASVSTGRLWKLVVAPWAVQGQLYDVRWLLCVAERD